MYAYFLIKEYPLNERGMKKQMSMDTTDAIICDVEKKHKCVIQKSIPAEKTKKKTEAPILDGGSIAGTSGASTMKLPYHSMSFVNDKEVKLDSGQRITIVVGDLTQQTVYMCIVHSPRPGATSGVEKIFFFLGTWV